LDIIYENLVGCRRDPSPISAFEPLVLDTVRAIRVRAEASFSVFLVFGVVTCEEGHDGFSFDRHFIGVDEDVKPPILDYNDGAAPDHQQNLPYRSKRLQYMVVSAPV